MPNPITYKSPKLTRDVDNLVVPYPKLGFVCIDNLMALLKLKELPAANEYRIEASTGQWSDGSGCELWVRQRNNAWFWGSTEEYQEKAFFYEVMEALDVSGLAKNRPVRIYFRLTYCE